MKKKTIILSVPLQGVKKEDHGDVLNNVRVRMDNELERIGMKQKVNVITIPDCSVTVVE